MNTYGFTIKSDSGQLYSWIVEAVNRKEAFNKLNTGDKPDSIIILTCRLDEQQKNNWISASVEHGGFDHQMAQSILNIFWIMIIIYRADKWELFRAPQDINEAWELAVKLTEESGVQHYIGRI